MLADLGGTEIPMPTLASISSVKLLNRTDPQYQSHDKRYRNAREARKAERDTSLMASVCPNEPAAHEATNESQISVAALDPSATAIHPAAFVIKQSAQIASHEPSAHGDVADKAAANVSFNEPMSLIRMMPAATSCVTPEPPKSVGRLFEKAALHRIALRNKLSPCNILAAKEHYSDGTYTWTFREIDGVHFADYETVVLYEVKLASRGRMQDYIGGHQVETSASIAQHAYRIVRTRLVYVAAVNDPIRAIIPAVSIDDVESRCGVIFLTPDEIEAAAMSLGLVLPQDWADLDAKFGSTLLAA